MRTNKKRGKRKKRTNYRLGYPTSLSSSLPSLRTCAARSQGRFVGKRWSVSLARVQAAGRASGFAKIVPCRQPFSGEEPCVWEFHGWWKLRELTRIPEVVGSRARVLVRYEIIQLLLAQGSADGAVTLSLISPPGALWVFFLVWLTSGIHCQGKNTMLSSQQRTVGTGGRWDKTGDGMGQPWDAEMWDGWT